MSISPQTVDREAQRAERRARERELTERAVAQLRSSDGWQAWLRVRARTGLRRYSFGNQLLIAAQDPDATRVAGFRAWLSLGYAVRKGETCRIRIWARCDPSAKKLRAWRESGAGPAERPRSYYRLEAVFERAQVEPLPAPTVPAPLDPPIAPIAGDTLAWTLPELERFATRLGVTVVYETMAAGHDGSYHLREQRIRVSSTVSVNQQAAALVHELAHALVRLDQQPDDPTLDYATEELVAESITYALCGQLGLDTGANSIPYLAVWNEQSDPDAWQQIAALTDRLMRTLEDTLLPDDAEPTTRIDEGNAA